MGQTWPTDFSRAYAVEAHCTNFGPENPNTEDLRALLRKPMHPSMRIIDTTSQWREKQ
jgi:hypothetical protein